MITSEQDKNIFELCGLIAREQIEYSCAVKIFSKY